MVSGLRTEGAISRISVVVAVLNGARTVRRCIESVACQDQSCELIVMDGGSTDGTLSILKEHDRDIDCLESKADNGIYDAWNKALAIATGDWICFLGADDYYSGPTSLSSLAQHTATPGVNFISSKAAWVDPSGNCVRIVGEPWSWQRMQHHQVIAHPGALHHRSLFQEYGAFDARYRIAGDYEFLLRAGPRIVANFVDAVTVCMGMYGASLTDVRRVLRETRMIQAAHPKIGYRRANVNFLVAHGKHVVRRVMSWLR